MRDLVHESAQNCKTYKVKVALYVWLRWHAHAVQLNVEVVNVPTWQQ